MKKVYANFGQRFKIGNEEYVLAQTDYNEVNLISLQDGNRWTNPVDMAGGYCHDFTRAEILKIIGFGQKFKKIKGE